MRLGQFGVFLLISMPDQVIANEYLPGQGISAHIDCEPCFSEAIVSLSLLSPCEIIFRERRSDAKLGVVLEPRSAIVMKDDARYEWTHEIPARKSDIIDGAKVERSRRVSLTFRRAFRAF
jgi:alkylated DNA repair dioxygenase AlkB